MGEDYFDQWTVSHMIGGIVYRLVVFPNNPPLSFIVSVFIHTLGEIVEKSPHPITGAKETEENHKGDIAAFIVGWFIGCYINPYVPPYSQPLWWNVRFWLLIAATLVTIKEFVREYTTINTTLDLMDSPRTFIMNNNSETVQKIVNSIVFP